MRFHHSTRRGRNRLGHNSQQQLSVRWARSSAHNSSASRWSQLGYCRETNIHFNRRLPIEPPLALQTSFQANYNSCSTSKSLQYQPSSKESSPTGRTTSMLIEQQQRSSRPIISGSLRLKHQKSSDYERQTQDDFDLKLHKLSIEEAAEREKQGGLLSNLNKVDGENDLAKQTLQKRHHNTNDNNRGEQQYHCSAMGSKIDMESARQKLVAQVEKHRLWSSKAAKRMQLTSVQERHIYIYELVSFCERRDLEWRYEPYKGGLVPSIPYRHIDQLIPPLSPTLNGKVVKTSQLSSLQPDLAKSAATTTTTPSTSDLFAFSPIHKKTVLVGSPVESSQSPDSFWSTTTTNSSRRTIPSSSSMKASSNSMRTTSGITSLASNETSSNSPVKRTHFDSISSNAATDRPIPSAEFVWSIDVPAQMKPKPFYSQIHSTELPNSSFVKRCHGCQGKGKLKCNSCNGVGYEVCISCHGNGTTKSLSHGSSSLSSASGHRFKNSSYHSSSDYNNNHNSNHNSRNSTFANGYDTEQDQFSANYSGNSRGKGVGEPGGITSSGASNTFGSAWVTESCHFCHGAGQKRCLMCAGKSYNHCAGCLGSGQLRCFLNLNITWINHRDEIILNNSDNIIPKDRLRLCSGLMLVHEISENLLPLNCATIDGATGRIEETNQLSSVSKKLLDKHKQTYRQERLIKQVS